MDRNRPLVIDPLAAQDPSPRPGGTSLSSVHASAVSWGAILAGAAGAAALSLILLILGTGLGLSLVSPWSGQGVAATAFGVSTILWISLTQLAASGMGGYLAGRLRTRWASVQADEVYFRDTAHGFLAWAVSTLATAALLTSVIGNIVGGGVQAGTAVAAQSLSTSADARKEVSSQATAYFVDALFRRDVAPPAGAVLPVRADLERDQAEVSRLFASALRLGALPPEDARYAGALVATDTGLPATDAQKRVVDVFSRLQARVKDAEDTARDVADKARKASAYAALWLFVSLLAGAFVASLSATFGGRQRDL